MAISMERVMKRIRNYFQRGYTEGEFAITGNVLAPAPSAPFVAIRGSAYHDGVYECCNGYLGGMPDGKQDETFTGVVWHLHPPDDFIALCEEIARYDEKNPAGAMHSETFGDYSYTRGTNGSGAVTAWDQAFAASLAPYRKMFTEVD